MIGRFCKIINKDGSRCMWPVEKAIDLCWIHDTENPPVFFIKEHKKYKGLKTMSKRQAEYYIRRGFAVKASVRIVQEYKDHLLGKIREEDRDFLISALKSSGDVKTD